MEVLEWYAVRGLLVFRTDEQGTVELSMDGQRLWVETGR
jgi:beta-lactamase superfamily II metal-dependent hydrolase